MDVYASLLRQAAGLRELNQLAHALLVTNPQAAEAWVTLALLSDRKGRRETAAPPLASARAAGRPVHRLKPCQGKGELPAEGTCPGGSHL